MPPPIVAIVGAPNAGKSTLFNRLLGRRRALVHERPGMTRDVIEETCDWDGVPVVLLDTGGLFPPGDPSLGERVRDHVLRAAAGADVLVVVVDGREGVTLIDEDLARLFHSSGRPAVLAVNKLDVPGHEWRAADFHRLGFEPVVPISAEHDRGMDLLRAAVASLLDQAPREGGEEPPGGAPRAAPAEIKVAIVGRPNVGKSSLLNRLLGQERTLVSDVPGTTRDAIDCLARRGPHAYRFIDTAGIRRRGKVERGPEALSVMTARRSASRADVVLVLMDATEAPTLQDLHVAGIASEAGRPFAVLLNKWDLLAATTHGPGGGADAVLERVRGRLRFAPYAPVLSISALSGLRIERVFPLVDQIHAQAMRRLPTGALNAWLQDSVAAHRPPSSSGRALKFFYAVQKAANPPAFVVFTSQPGGPHFSYRRYLENTLRERFDLTHTPVILTYRQRPRRTAVSAAGGKKGRRRRV